MNKKNVIIGFFLYTAAVSFLSILSFRLYTKRFDEKELYKVDNLSQLVFIQAQVIELEKRSAERKKGIIESTSFADSVALDSLFKILPTK